MKKLILSAALAALCAPAFAADIMAQDPFVFATTKTQKAGGAFISLMTHGAPDRLLSAASPAAKRVEIHTHVMQDGVMKMREVEGPLPLTAEQPIEMAPGGIHVMLMGLTAPLAEGETVEVTLTFETAGDVIFNVPIVNRADHVRKGHGGGHKHGHGN